MKHIITIAALAALTACGGGGGSNGGSVMALPVSAAGTDAPGPAVQAQPAEPAPAKSASQYPPCSVVYYGDSISALTAPRLDPRLEVATRAVPGGTAAAAVAQFLQDPLEARYVVIEYGMNESNGNTPLEPALRSMLDRLKALSRVPVLTRMSNATAGGVQVRQNLNFLVGVLAGEYKALDANWPSVQYAGAADLMTDGVHPNDAYQQRLADRLSETILKECTK